MLGNEKFDPKEYFSRTLAGCGIPSGVIGVYTHQDSPVRPFADSTYEVLERFSRTHPPRSADTRIDRIINGLQEQTMQSLVFLGVVGANRIIERGVTSGALYANPSLLEGIRISQDALHRHIGLQLNELLTIE